MTAAGEARDPTIDPESRVHFPHGAPPVVATSDGRQRSVRPAATVMLIREIQPNFEVLLLQRHSRSGFAASAWVFPGGVVEEADALLNPDCWHASELDTLAVRAKEPRDQLLARHVAAVRETFEEAGILLARRADGAPVQPENPEMREMRSRLQDGAGAAEFVAWVERSQLVLDLAALTYWSRWITPRVEPRRYDTSFFLARVPEGQVAGHDRIETTAHRWTSPTTAISDYEHERLHLIYPTVRNLQELAGEPTFDGLVMRARKHQEVPRIIPHYRETKTGWQLLEPGHPDFPSHLYQEELS